MKTFCCFVLLLVGLSESIGMWIVPNRRTCYSWKCLSGLRNSDDIDMRCRNSRSLQQQYCYCCGGQEDYIEFGLVCRRFCRKDPGPNPEPCRPLPGPEPSDGAEKDAFFPQYPSLKPLNEIDCNGLSTSGIDKAAKEREKAQEEEDPFLPGGFWSLQDELHGEDEAGDVEIDTAQEDELQGPPGSSDQVQLLETLQLHDSNSEQGNPSDDEAGPVQQEEEHAGDNQQSDQN